MKNFQHNESEILEFLTNFTTNQNFEFPTFLQNGQRRSQCCRISSGNEFWLLSNDLYSDVRFVVIDGTEIPAFSYFLKSRSLVFKTLLNGQFKESQDKLIPIKCTKNVLDAFLHHVYTFHFQLPVIQELDEIFTLADLCEQHEFKAMKIFCTQHLESLICDENARQVYDMAVNFGNCDVKTSAVSYVIEQDPLVAFNEAFFTTSLHLVKDLLANDGLWARCEVNLFRIVKLYVQKNCVENLEESLLWKELLPEIRFSLMSVEDIAVDVAPSGLLTDSELVSLFSWVASNGKVGKPLFCDSPRKKRYPLRLRQSKVAKLLDIDGITEKFVFGWELYPNVQNTWKILVKKCSVVNWSDLIIGVAYTNCSTTHYLGRTNLGFGFCCNGQKTNSDDLKHEPYKEGDILTFFYNKGCLSVTKNWKKMFETSNMPLKSKDGLPLCIACSANVPVQLEIL